MRWAAGSLIFALLAGCTPAPRAVSYFRAHPGEAAQVLVDCERGVHRGAECANADAATERARAAARLNEYRKSF